MTVRMAVFLLFDEWIVYGDFRGTTRGQKQAYKQTYKQTQRLFMRLFLPLSSHAVPNCYYTIGRAEMQSQLESPFASMIKWEKRPRQFSLFQEKKEDAMIQQLIEKIQEDQGTDLPWGWRSHAFLCAGSM